MFFRPAVAARVKKGDRVFGSASVSCPECTVGRTYALSFTYAIAGWFAELPDWKNADMLVPKMVTPDGLTAFYGFINSIPDNKRIQIPAR